MSTQRAHSAGVRNRLVAVGSVPQHLLVQDLGTLAVLVDDLLKLAENTQTLQLAAVLASLHGPLTVIRALPVSISLTVLRRRVLPDTFPSASASSVRTVRVVSIPRLVVGDSADRLLGTIARVDFGCEVGGVLGHLRAVVSVVSDGTINLRLFVHTDLGPRVVLASGVGASILASRNQRLHERRAGGVLLHEHEELVTRSRL